MESSSREEWHAPQVIAVGEEEQRGIIHEQQRLFAKQRISLFFEPVLERSAAAAAKTTSATTTTTTTTSRSEETV